MGELANLPDGTLSSLIFLQLALVTVICASFEIIKRQYVMVYGEKSGAIDFMSVIATVCGALVLYPLLDEHGIPPKQIFVQHAGLLVVELGVVVLVAQAIVFLFANPEAVMEFVRKRDPVFWAISLFSIVLGSTIVLLTRIGV